MRETIRRKIRKQEKGITLIALIVTIIVLIILAGVAIMALSDQGILTKASKAAEEMSKAEVEEEIRLEISEIRMEEPTLAIGGELANKLEGNLEQLTVREVLNSEIKASWAEKYYITISENDVIVEDLPSEMLIKIKENVLEMKEDKTLKEEDIVQTRGYYTAEDEGDGKYRIISSTDKAIDEGRIIELDNGLLAELIISNKTINIKQYGAYGDGTQDDTDKIRLAFNQIDTEECDNIHFTDGTYIIKEKVAMYSGTYTGTQGSKIQIIGRSYDIRENADGTTEKVAKEYAFYNNKEIEKCDSTDTIILDSLNVSVNMESTGDRDHINMFRFFHTDGVQVKNCKFSTEEGNGIGVCPIDLYTANKNFVLENCNSKIYAIEQGLNSHIMVRERYEDNITSDIKLNNYNVEKNGRDESLWIDAWVGTLSNVEISNCYIKDVGVSTSTLFLGANESTSKAINISMHDCTIEKEQFSNGILKLAMTEHDIAGKSTNLKFYNNTVNIKSNLNNTLQNGSAVLQINTPYKDNKESSEIYIENNTIIAEEATIGTVIRDYSNNYITTARNNQIKINNISTDSAFFNGVYCGLKEVDSDKFSNTQNGAIVCPYLLRNCKTIKGIEGSIQGMFINDYHTPVEEMLIKDCNLSVTGNVINSITTSTNLNTTRVQNCNFNNSGNFVGVWYTDVNSSGIEGTGLTVIKQNVTLKKESTAGTVTVTTEDV